MGAYFSISDLLSVLAILISLFNLFYILFSRRKSLDFSIRAVDIPTRKDVIFLESEFINKSTLPISISSVEMKVGENWFSCDKWPRRYMDYRLGPASKEPFEKGTINTAALPIKLESLENLSAILVFSNDALFDDVAMLGKELLFRITTNRGFVTVFTAIPEINFKDSSNLFKYVHWH